MASRKSQEFSISEQVKDSLDALKNGTRDDALRLVYDVMPKKIMRLSHIFEVTQPPFPLPMFLPSPPSFSIFTLPPPLPPFTPPFCIGLTSKVSSRTLRSLCLWTS